MDDELTSADKKMRMDAYYYGFHWTGTKAIDTILSAVACAGKAYHHTEDWTNEAAAYPHLRGETPVDWIQNAANDAAAPDPAVVALVRAARLLHDNIVEGAFIKEENIILMQDALAPFKHIEDERQ